MERKRKGRVRQSSPARILPPDGTETRLGECGIAEKDLDALAVPVDKQGWKLGEHHNIDSRVAREI